MSTLGFENLIDPRKLIKLLYWFSQKLGVEQIAKYNRIGLKSVSKATECLRMKLTKKIIRVQRDDKMLGRGNTAVCIDCTYITKRKRHKKFKGKTTAGHVTCIFGAYEIDLSTRRRQVELC